MAKDITNKTPSTAAKRHSSSKGGRPQKRHPHRTHSKTHTPKGGDSVRNGVFQVLKTVFKGKQTLDVAFTQYKNNFGGADESRNLAFAYTLAAGTLRTALFLDGLSHQHLKKPFEADSDQNIILRIGIYQLLFMDGVKDHAAISTTVDMMKHNRLHHLSGVTNAVLRQIQRKNAEHPIELAADMCLPSWIQKEFSADYGDENVDVLAGYMLEQAPVDIRVYQGATPEGSVALDGLEKAYRLPDGTHASSIEGLNTGGVYIQDMAAQWPASLLAKLIKAKKLNGPVVDMCAAPGGKTLQLLDLLENPIYAADLNPRRLQKLGENLAHIPRKPFTVACNGYTPPFAENSIAGLLLDAPCTATGTSRRHPEVIHLRQPADLEHLQAAQRKILEQAAMVLQPGGVLVYAVCSLFHKEGEAQDAWALENLALKPLAFDVPTALKTAHTKAHTLRLTPEHGCDGFYIACYEKQS